MNLLNQSRDATNVPAGTDSGRHDDASADLLVNLQTFMSDSGNSTFLKTIYQKSNNKNANVSNINILANLICTAVVTGNYDFFVNNHYCVEILFEIGHDVTDLLRAIAFRPMSGYPFFNNPVLRNMFFELFKDELTDFQVGGGRKYSGRFLMMLQRPFYEIYANPFTMFSAIETRFVIGMVAEAVKILARFLKTGEYFREYIETFLEHVSTNVRREISRILEVSREMYIHDRNNFKEAARELFLRMDFKYLHRRNGFHEYCSSPWRDLPTNLPMDVKWDYRTFQVIFEARCYFLHVNGPVNAILRTLLEIDETLEALRNNPDRNYFQNEQLKDPFLTRRRRDFVNLIGWSPKFTRDSFQDGTYVQCIYTTPDTMKFEFTIEKMQQLCDLSITFSKIFKISRDFDIDAMISPFEMIFPYFDVSLEEFVKMLITITKISHTWEHVRQLEAFTTSGTARRTIFSKEILAELKSFQRCRFWGEDFDGSDMVMPDGRCSKTFELTPQIISKHDMKRNWTDISDKFSDDDLKRLPAEVVEFLCKFEGSVLSGGTIVKMMLGQDLDTDYDIYVPDTVFSQDVIDFMVLHGLYSVATDCFGYSLRVLTFTDAYIDHHALNIPREQFLKNDHELWLVRTARGFRSDDRDLFDRLNCMKTGFISDSTILTSENEIINHETMGLINICKPNDTEFKIRLSDRITRGRTIQIIFCNRPPADYIRVEFDIAACKNYLQMVNGNHVLKSMYPKDFETRETSFDFHPEMSCNLSKLKAMSARKMKYSKNFKFVPGSEIIKKKLVLDKWARREDEIIKIPYPRYLLCVKQMLIRYANVVTAEDLNRVMCLWMECSKCNKRPICNTVFGVKVDIPDDEMYKMLQMTTGNCEIEEPTELFDEDLEHVLKFLKLRGINPRDVKYLFAH